MRVMARSLFLPGQEVVLYGVAHELALERRRRFANFCRRKLHGDEHRSLCCEFEGDMGSPHTSRVVCLK